MRVVALRKKLEVLSEELDALRMELSGEEADKEPLYFFVHLEVSEAAEDIERASKMIENHLKEMDS